MDVGIAQQPDLLRLLPEAMHHRRRDIVRAVNARELVRVGKEISLQRPGRGIDVAQQEEIVRAAIRKSDAGPSPACSTAQRNVEHVVALGHDHGARIHIAACDAAAKTSRALAGSSNLYSPAFSVLHALGVVAS